MALLFKRNTSINACRDWNATISSASVLHSFQEKLCEYKSLEKAVSQLSSHLMHNHASKVKYKKVQCWVL